MDEWMPVVGMKVELINAHHCCGNIDNNECCEGVVTQVENPDSFLVKSNTDPENEWFRCRKCVSPV